MKQDDFNGEYVKYVAGLTECFHIVAQSIVKRGNGQILYDSLSDEDKILLWKIYALYPISAFDDLITLLDVDITYIKEVVLITLELILDRKHGEKDVSTKAQIARLTAYRERISDKKIYTRIGVMITRMTGYGLRLDSEGG